VADGQNVRTVAEVLNHCKEDLKDFVSTRVQMLRGEMRDKLTTLKLVLPALAVGAILLLGAFFLFTWGLVSLIAMAMTGEPYAYPVAFFAVFALYALAGGATVVYGLRTLTAHGLTPERTLRVLKEDQIWLQSEARTQL